MDFKKITTGRLLLILGIIIIIIPPLLVRTAFWNALDFSNSGQIGDTIGGITSPFINSIAAILVFIAFKEQIKANNLLKEQQYFQHIQEQIHRLEEDFFNLPIVIKDISQGIIDSSRQRLNYDDDGRQTHYLINAELLNKVIYTTALFSQTAELIDKLENKEFMQKKLKTLYKIIYQDKYRILNKKLNPLLKMESSVTAYVAETLLQIQDLERKFGD